MSRAISDKLSCALSREDPISKDWAKVLPPQTDNLNVTRKALFEFLTRRLEPEPKTVQELYDMAQKVTPEEKYYSVIQLLDQWDDEHIKKSKANENFAKSSANINFVQSKACKSNAQGNVQSTQIDKKYLDWKTLKINAAKAELDLVKQELCFKELDRIMDRIYSDIKHKHVYNAFSLI
jgi:hypothetical protein